MNLAGTASWSRRWSAATRWDRLQPVAFRATLLVGVAALASRFPHQQALIVQIAVAGQIAAAAAEQLLWHRPRWREPAVAAASVACWATLIAHTGYGHSPFLAGFFVDIMLAALRASLLGCALATGGGAAVLAACAWLDPSAPGERTAVTGAICLLSTGATFWLLVRGMRRDTRREARDELHTAHVAHGVKNSLHGVAGFAELLASQLPAGDPRRNMTDGIRRGVEDAHLRLAALMAPPADAHDPADLRRAADAAVQCCRGVLERGRVAPSVTIPQGLRARVGADTLCAILVDLIHNAIESMQPHGGTVRIEAKGRPLRLLVRDSGPGIPARLRTKVFERGFTTRSNGHGLGLSGAAAALHASGGVIRARRAPGGGAEIEIRLRAANGNRPRPRRHGNMR